MTLIKSISGIRGTIGGSPGNNFTPPDIVACSSGYGHWLKQQGQKNAVVIGRDARISGEIVSHLVCSTLRAMGIDVIDLGLSTTPTVEMAVTQLGAGGGIILTASHNPIEWNALKFLNHKGEFISPEDGKAILAWIDEEAYRFESTLSLGSYTRQEGMIGAHIEHILQLPWVQADLVRSKAFKVVVDCINSTGSISVAPLLEQLGCELVLIHDDLSGHFAHNPEPLPAHLHDLVEAVRSSGADLGISIDPDVDRLAFINEDGSLFGEEYTLVAVADYMLSKNPGRNTVSNLSSTRALRDVTQAHGGQYFASAVGEVHVVNKMKAANAIIGGEGNGGIIVPALHYGRDALAGIALFLSHLAEKDMPMSVLRATYPQYAMVKDKLDLVEGMNLKALIEDIKPLYAHAALDDTDGLKIDLAEGWIHLRGSNTEPIIRIYTEAADTAAAQVLAAEAKSRIQSLILNTSPAL